MKQRKTKSERLQETDRRATSIGDVFDNPDVREFFENYDDLYTTQILNLVDNLDGTEDELPNGLAKAIIARRSMREFRDYMERAIQSGQTAREMLEKLK